MKKLSAIALTCLLSITTSTYAEDVAPDATEPGEEATQIAGQVARAQLATAVVNREPVDNIGPMITASGEEPFKLYYFTDLRDFSGQIVSHRWERDGEVVAEVNFTVGANRWRTFSSKNFTRHMDGNWQVSVISGDKVIHTDEFIFQWENNND